VIAQSGGSDYDIRPGPLMPAKTKRRRTLPRIPKLRQNAVTREEFNHVIEMINGRGQVVDEMRRELEVQFRRIAQLQLEVDGLKKTR
jgi:hypothetical protein